MYKELSDWLFLAAAFVVASALGGALFEENFRAILDRLFQGLGG